jgi:hypothetical protein
VQNAVLELELALGGTARTGSGASPRWSRASPRWVATDTSKIKGASSGVLGGVGGTSDGGLLGFPADPLDASGGALVFELSEGPSVGAPYWEWSTSRGAPSAWTGSASDVTLTENSEGFVSNDIPGEIGNWQDTRRGTKAHAWSAPYGTTLGTVGNWSLDTACGPLLYAWTGWALTDCRLSQGLMQAVTKHSPRDWI